jgi:hypothetical protein
MAQPHDKIWKAFLYQKFPQISSKKTETYFQKKDFSLFLEMCSIGHWGLPNC